MSAKKKKYIKTMTKKNLNLLLANPRGFCAGVDRAISIVERALEKYGAPVYVRHEIVHNKFVLEQLRAKGAIFVDDLDQVPTDAPVIFSAHGVPKTVPAEAERRNMLYIDATCPLVSKVHREAERHHKNGSHVLLIGHAGHPEVIGTMGQLPPEHVTLIETIDDVKNLKFKENDDVAYATQTTLSIDDTTDIIAALKERFPNIAEPKKEDICYATTNRQNAVKDIAELSDLLLVIGAPNSSNSQRLVEVAKKYGCANAQLIGRVSEINWDWFKGIKSVGLTAGASAPDILINEVIDTLKDRYNISEKKFSYTEENITFNLPRILAS